MLLHWCQDAEIPLQSLVVVIDDIVLNHLDQDFPVRESSAIVALPLEDSPEPLHRAVVYTLSYTGHTLLHPSIFQLLVEGTVRVLETSVAVEQGSCTGIGRCRLVKGIKNQWIVIPVTDHIGNDPVTV